MVRGPMVVSGYLPGGPRARATFLFCKDINTKPDQFWQFSMAQFSLVVRNREIKFVSGPPDSQTVEDRWYSLLSADELTFLGYLLSLTLAYPAVLFSA